jgi:hypothetical protein
MAKGVHVGQRIASKISKSWGKGGKVVKVSGMSTSKKFDVAWDDGSVTLAVSSRAICLEANLGQKPKSRAKAKKSSVPASSAALSDDEFSPDDTSDSSESEASIELNTDAPVETRLVF